MKKIKVSIAEDEYLVAELMKQALNKYSDIEVLDIAKNGILALSVLEANQPDILLLDINMPEMNGIDTLIEIQKRFPDVRCIMLSFHTEHSYIDKSFGHGAWGYISKTIGSEELYNAIKTVSNGGHYMCSEVVKSMAGKDKFKNDARTIFGKDLSPREREVLHYITLGFYNPEIAEKMTISVRTVESHRRNILRKFGEKNFIGLIRSLMEKNLIDISEYMYKDTKGNGNGKAKITSKVRKK